VTKSLEKFTFGKVYGTVMQLKAAHIKNDKMVNDTNLVCKMFDYDAVDESIVDVLISEDIGFLTKTELGKYYNTDTHDHDGKLLLMIYHKFVHKNNDVMNCAYVKHGFNLISTLSIEVVKEYYTAGAIKFPSYIPVFFSNLMRDNCEK